MKKRLLGGMLALASATAMATSAPAPATTIIVKSQEPQFTVQLPANATTGYQWYLQSYDHHLLKLMGYRYHVSNPKLMGSPGTAVFVFAGQPTFFLAPQQTTLHFWYAQPWELSKGEGKTVTIVSVEQAAAPTTASVANDSEGNMMLPVSSSS